jgi:hypothetical protein
MKKVLMAAGFLFLLGGLILEIWSPQQRHSGWVCGPVEDNTSNATDGIHQICSTTRYDGVARGDAGARGTRSPYDETKDFPAAFEDGTTFAIIGVGFLIGAVAVGQGNPTQPRLPAATNGPSAMAGAAPMPGGTAPTPPPPAPGMGGPGYGPAPHTNAPGGPGPR